MKALMVRDRATIYIFQQGIAVRGHHPVRVEIYIPPSSAFSQHVKIMQETTREIYINIPGFHH
jgi:hypothetical protein